MDTNTNTKKVEGFTKVPNRLIENLVKTKLSGSELIVFLIICRQTFGFHKNADKLAGSQIADFSYFPTPYVFRVLKKLESKGIVQIVRGGWGRINIISISPDTSTWLVDYRKSSNHISQDIKCNISPDTLSDTSQDTHKRKIERKERNIAVLKQKMVELGLKK